MVRKNIRDIFLRAVDSVKPDILIKENIRIENEYIHISKLKYNLKEINNIYVIGAGKASSLMALEVEKIIGNYISEGVVITKYNHRCSTHKIKILEAGHPIPDQMGYLATKELVNIVSKAQSNDLIICLLSGGGSSLLTDFPDGSTLKDLSLINNLLVKSGADINEINCVRKHVSYIKGGGLAHMAYPANLVSLILSDVVGDPIDVICSGPTVPDRSSYLDALQVLKKYHLEKEIPSSIEDYILQGIQKEQTGKSLNVDDDVFKKVHNIIIGNNQKALLSASINASNYGYNPIIRSDRVIGDVQAIAKLVVEESLEFQKDKNIKKPLCLIWGGEPTITISGKGLGGRNQHLASLISHMLIDKQGITVLCAGTDGSDGPTDATGAVVDVGTFNYFKVNGKDPLSYINSFDTYYLFHNSEYHIITGPTQTNVMDIILAVIE